MSWSVRFFDVEGVSPAQQQAAEKLFRKVLEQTLGDASLVVPVYLAYRKMVSVYGEAPAEDVLTDAEKAVFDQWQEAETAAVAAVFGPHRYMGDAVYEIVVDGAKQGRSRE